MFLCHHITEYVTETSLVLKSRVVRTQYYVNTTIENMYNI